MTPWEADYKKIEALPPHDRANVMRWKIVTSAVVKVMATIAGAGGIATALVKWLG